MIRRAQVGRINSVMMGMAVIYKWNSSTGMSILNVNRVCKIL